MQYTIREEKSKFVIYKKDKPLLLPCKLIKKKKVEFDSRLEAEKYIKDAIRLIQKGEEYLERF